MLNYIILGILQGIFEWIPVSSEGVLALFSQFLTDVNAVDIALFLHLGTLLAVIIYFSKDWKQVVTIKDKKLLKFLIITTIISLTIGYPMYRIIRNIAIGNSLLIIVGTGLLITSYFHKSKKRFNLNFEKLAVVSGFLQGFAVIPGLSRSGSTIFGLSLGDLKPEQILRISYMMSAPVVLASSLYLLYTSPILLQAWPALISSFIVGFLTLHLLMKLSQKINFFKFTLVFGLLCYLGALIGFLA
ncbi:undecaprenyl-diphosphate phosphatase [Candidatus Woesearchaeota archaeon]|nr:undecaprenyl-diphosphate phosphatase [Candidatus Woesearchaeota archaeon]